MKQTSSRPFVLLAVFILISGCAQTPPPPDATGDSSVLVIDGARIWDGTGKPAVPDGVLVVRNGRISAVGARAAVTVPQGATIVDAKGKTLIPGIINAHGHVGLTKGLVQSQANYSKESIHANLQQSARYGVTAVWSLGLDSEPMFELRGPASEQESPRATVFIAGRGFTGKAGYPTMLAGFAGIPFEVANADEIKARIKELAGQKVDVVKIWVDSQFERYPRIRPDLYKTIIEEAHRENLRVVAHVFYLADAKGLVEAGVNGLVHSIRDREIDDELIRSMKEKNVFYVSTLIRDHSLIAYANAPAFLDDPFLTRWGDPEAIKALKDPAYGTKARADADFPKLAPSYQTAMRNFKKLYDAGVRLALGADTGPPGRFHGYFEHLELEQMVKAGLTPQQALQIATLEGARSLGMEKDFGSLESGKRADMVLLDADPLEDILHTRKVGRVWVGGREVQ